MQRLIDKSVMNGPEKLFYGVDHRAIARGEP